MIHKLKEILSLNKMTISVAESCTSGSLQSLLTSIDGSSDYFEGGITVYNINQKVKHLKVNRKVAEKVDCVSQKVADQMAIGVANLFETRISISTTGYIDRYLFYSIVIDNKVIYHSKMDLSNFGGRSDSQLFASINIISKLIEVIQNHEI